MRKKEPNRNSGSLKQTKFSYLELSYNYIHVPLCLK